MKVWVSNEEVFDLEVDPEREMLSVGGSRFEIDDEIVEEFLRAKRNYQQMRGTLLEQIPEHRKDNL
jgi:hypothetical protein